MTFSSEQHEATSLWNLVVLDTESSLDLLLSEFPKLYIVTHWLLSLQLVRSSAVSHGSKVGHYYYGRWMALRSAPWHEDQPYYACLAILSSRQDDGGGGDSGHVQQLPQCSFELDATRSNRDVSEAKHIPVCNEC